MTLISQPESSHLSLLHILFHADVGLNLIFKLQQLQLCAIIKVFVDVGLPQVQYGQELQLEPTEVKSIKVIVEDIV